MSPSLEWNLTSSVTRHGVARTHARTRSHAHTLTRSPTQSCGPEQMHNPRGTQFLDSAALLPEQQQRLNERKAEGRKQNENYLAAHPEVQLSINLFVQEVLEVVNVVVRVLF